MLQVDKRPFILIGACEAASQVFSMIGASHLPGVLIPIINQSYLLWSFLLAALILKTRFHPSQLIGALLVVAGVALSVLPPDVAASLWQGSPSTAASTLPGAAIPSVELKYVALVVACFSLPALASIMKDKIFREEKERLGKPLDIFVVNSFGSAFQALFVVLLLPVTTSLARVPLDQLPDYLTRGSQCLQGLTPACGTDCSLSPLLPFAYIVMNLLFNVSMLLLLRSIGAVGTTMVSSLLVPLTIAAFTLVPASFLPPPTLSSNFLLGAFILVCGQLTFNMPKLKAAFGRPKPA
uniref:EamA domain-containing protein n=1 Tax=Dunaliella tertiolecta TaxID=3047 RepID=A0A7S3VPT9_DUNTE|mmetsp:Transcript_3708/g.10039  ORF Transcript_3708/g.10039 Transcript_3708/m.10039 type:complete len:295 (+) Transcript_3708:211-1095(+)